MAARTSQIRTTKGQIAKREARVHELGVEWSLRVGNHKVQLRDHISKTLRLVEGQADLIETPRPETLSDGCRHFAAGGLMRCCQLLRGMRLLENASLAVPAGILYRQLWETWLVSLYVLLEGAEALREIGGDYVKHARILSKKFDVDPEHVPDPDEEARKLKIYALAERIGPLLIEAGEAGSADMGVQGYDGVYRVQSQYAVHAGLSTMTRHIRIKDESWSVEPNPPPPFDHDHSQYAANYTLHLAKYVFERFGIATGAIEAAMDELWQHGGYVRTAGAPSQPESRDMSPSNSRSPSPSTINSQVRHLVDESAGGTGPDSTSHCDTLADDIVEPVERNRQQEGESPMILSFDRIEMQTSVRLVGVRSLLHLLKDLAPEKDLDSEQDFDSEYVKRKQAELREFARERGLEAGEYFAEREVLDYELKARLPQFMAFAIVTQLLTILEVHLHECAKRVEKRMSLCFSPDDLKGRGIEKYARYLSKSGVYNAKEDQAAWHEVTDLRAIRNLIVHEAGTDIKEEDAKRLKETYKEGFNYSEDESGWWTEVWISPDLCQRFTERVEALTEECLSAVKRAELHDDD